MSLAWKWFSLEEVLELYTWTNNEAENDIDSSTGGMSSGEKLDEELQNLRVLEADVR